MPRSHVPEAERQAKRASSRRWHADPKNREQFQKACARAVVTRRRRNLSRPQAGYGQPIPERA